MINHIDELTAIKRRISEIENEVAGEIKTKNPAIDTVKVTTVNFRLFVFYTIKGDYCKRTYTASVSSMADLSKILKSS